MKTVKAVKPYIHTEKINFKHKPYEAWVNIGGKILPSHYPYRPFHGLFYRTNMPSLCKNRQYAVLMFVESVSINFDTFPYYVTHEIIPFIWDVWPRYDEYVIRWFKRNKVRTCILTSSEAAKRIKEQLPNLNVLVVTEGIDVENYPMGKKLVDRDMDLFIFGRNPSYLWKEGEFNDITFKWGGDDKEFKRLLQNSKITLAFPRCDVEPEQTGGQETLTQRYWECMLSGMVMVGRAPKELIDLIGYNPVIEVIDKLPSDEEVSPIKRQITDILSKIEVFQDLVDKNRETALRMAPWEIRIKQVMEWLKNLGYEV